MRRLLIVSVLLIPIIGLAIVGMRGVGHSLEYPFQFAQRTPIPLDVPFDALFPLQIGAFKRLQTNKSPRTLLQERLQTSGAATYARPGDKDAVYVELRLYATEQIAGLLINPADWRLHSRKSNKFFVQDVPMPFVFTMTTDGYHAYQLDYVSGRWNVEIRSINNLDALIAFANQYPY